MIKSLRIEVPITAYLNIKRTQVIPYIKTTPFRGQFNEKAKKKQRLQAREPTHSIYRDFFNGWKDNLLEKWFESNHEDVQSKTIELHMPKEHWHFNQSLVDSRIKLLSDPKYKTAFYFISSHPGTDRCVSHFKGIMGHPAGTEMFVINNIIYRCLTWRSIISGHWNKRYNNNNILWQHKNELVFFLHECKSINQEPMKSAIIDGIRDGLFSNET